MRRQPVKPPFPGDVLAANRGGRMTPEQAQWLYSERFTFVGFDCTLLIFCGIGFVFTLLNDAWAGGMVIALIILLVSIGMLGRLADFMMDARDQFVIFVDGEVTYLPGYRESIYQARYLVHSANNTTVLLYFDIQKDYWFANQTIYYRVYYTPRSMVLLSYEPLPLRRE